MHPKVSIILPVYNVEKYIAKSIQSVLNQTFTDFELLIVIDGSPDNSKQIAEEFAVKDQRIKVFEKENGGLSDARNYGLERARGEYVYFMDSDDWIEPDLLLENLKLLKKDKLDFIVFGYIQDNEDKMGNFINSILYQPRYKVLRKETSFTLDLHHLGILGYAWNKIYSREFLIRNELKFEKGISLVEDILFNSRVFKYTDNINFNSQAFYHYLNRPVTTLIKTFHYNSFELMKKKILYLESFFDAWNIKERKHLSSLVFMNSIRFCIHNMFSYKNQLSFKEKIGYINIIMNDEMTKNAVKSYQTESISDKIYTSLIKYKNAFILAFLAQMWKKNDL